MSVRDLGAALLDLLFPSRCPFCAKLSDGVCPVCGAALPWTGEEDGVRRIGVLSADGVLPVESASPGIAPPENAGREEPRHLLCAAPLRYEGLARKGLLRMKFRGRSAAAGDLGGLIAQCAAERLGGLFDTVTWVPVSRRRLRKRGYDQAELLCRGACRPWDTVPVRLVEKVRDNPAQSGLSDPEQRRENVKDVYRLRGGVSGRRVLLIDDICTTGSTLRSCASVLMRGGAASVCCAAAALAGPDRR